MEMNYLDIQDEQLAMPLVEFRDVVKALKQSHPTSTPDSLQKYVDWTKSAGTDGS